MEWKKLKQFILASLFVGFPTVLVKQATAASSAFVGFNYGTELSVVPSSQQVVNLLNIQQIKHIRLYDANSSMLRALAGTGIQVMVTVPNTQLLSVGESNASAINWVKNNVMAYLPNTNITAICVGTEVLTSDPGAALVLVPAMNFLHSALVAAELDSQIKISTTHAPDIILDLFPPSQAFFNRSWNTVLLPMFDFLSKTGSYFMLNVYSYDIYKESNGVISLDYALLNPLPPNKAVVDSNTLFVYTNLFDAVVDAAYFAMAQLNYTSIPLVVAETGWPSKGGTSDTEATMDNASTYNSNLIRRIVNTTGTPKRPRTAINTYIFEIFNEDLRVGPPTIKNYGLFNSSNLNPVYLLHLNGSGPLLANDTTDQLYCVARPGSANDILQISLDWACGPGHAECSAIQPGKLCYEPDTVAAHASYAFNSYYQKNKGIDNSCDFSGAAIITTTNPSYGTCIYPVSSNTMNGNGNTSIIRNATGPATSESGSSSAVDLAVLTSRTIHIFITIVSLFMLMGVSSHF